MTLSARFVLKALQRLSQGTLLIRLPDGTKQVFGERQSGPRAEIDVRDWRFFRRVLLDGDIGLAESYMAGECESPDLPKLIALLAANQHSLAGVDRNNPLHNLARRLLHRRRDNSRAGAERNVHAHYDLGNSFYRLWLDRTMTYSSALYQGATEGGAASSLERAQSAKYERVLSELGARQGESVLEIGCGWGGFAETAARRGLNVTAITISRQQLDYARERLQRVGLADRVNLQYRDYRDIEGRYDHILSIEMVEAVGERYWPDYFAALRRHLAPGGSALVQAIVIADEFFESYRLRPDFIQTYIFPGGMLLSRQRIAEQCRRAGLKVAGLYSFGLDYAQTLETWLRRFDQAAGDVAKLGFDERFRRMWRYYLAYCAAGFSIRRTDVLQAHFKPI